MNLKQVVDILKFILFFTWVLFGLVPLTIFIFTYIHARALFLVVILVPLSFFILMLVVIVRGVKNFDQIILAPVFGVLCLGSFMLIGNNEFVAVFYVVGLWLFFSFWQIGKKYNQLADEFKYKEGSREVTITVLTFFKQARFHLLGASFIIILSWGVLSLVEMIYIKIGTNTTISIVLLGISVVLIWFNETIIGKID